MQPNNYALDITQNLGNLYGSQGQGMSLGQGPQPQQQAPAPQPGTLAGGPAVPPPQGPQNAQMNNQMQSAQLFKQQEAAAAKAQKFNDDRIALAKNFTTKNAEAFLVEHPEYAASLKDAMKNRSEVEQQQQVQQALGIAAAVANGDPSAGSSYARNIAKALDGVDDERRDALYQLADTIDNAETTDLAAQAVEMFAIANGGKDAVEAIQKVKQGPIALAAEKAKADKLRVEADVADATALDTALADLDFKKEQANNLRSEIIDRANRFGLDKKKVTAEIAKLTAETGRIGTEMSEKEQTDYGKALTDATFDNLIADDAESALKIFEDNSISFTEKDASGKDVASLGSVANGVANTLTSPFKQGLAGKAVGVAADAAGVTRDLDVADAALRRAIAEDIKKNRAPGDQSNTELKVAMDAQLSKLAGPEAKAAYMRKHLAERRLSANINTAKASFLGQNKGLGAAKQEIRIPTRDGDIVVPKGGSLQDAVGALSVKRVPKEDVEKRQALQARIRSMKDAGMSAEQITATLKKERKGG